MQEHRSLNGFLLDTLGRVPRAKETVRVDGVEIQIIEAESTQVGRVRMRRLSGDEAE